MDKKNPPPHEIPESPVSCNKPLPKWELNFFKEVWRTNEQTNKQMLMIFMSSRKLLRSVGRTTYYYIQCISYYDTTSWAMQSPFDWLKS